MRRPGFLGDLWGLDLAGTSWTNLTGAMAGAVPAARTLMGLAGCVDKVYLFGGFNDAGPLGTDGTRRRN